MDVAVTETIFREADENLGIQEALITIIVKPCTAVLHLKTLQSIQQSVKGAQIFDQQAQDALCIEVYQKLIIGFVVCNCSTT